MYEIITSSGCQSNRSVNLSIGSCFASILRITIVHQSISALAIINLRLGKHFSVCVCVSLCQFIIYSLSLCNFLMMTRLFLSLNYEQEKVNLFLCLVFFATLRCLVVYLIVIIIVFFFFLFIFSVLYRVTLT